jgi:eukaryotic-like serine/threonine-protein kinase
MADRHPAEKPIEKTSAADRAAFLDQACGRDPQLRAEIERLLQAHDQPQGLLDDLDAPAATTGPAPIREGPGTVVGLYKLLQQIGEGGMGVVYMAEQEKPVRRKVALKIIKPGMDSAQVIARFEAERQALAMMDHVNIARVLDAGTTATGRPYFVMELVHGISITQYCDENHLTPRERLELFIPVCQAIQHAHQKGIIHRDLKPSNVMVTLYDGKPVAKVIDFGVAKATEQKLTERTMFTQYGAIVGTLEYMSPEQAEMSGLGVDTRSDIYSLGVLLYELLTGTTPLERKRLRQQAYVDAVRLIKEQEPPRPSTRLSSSDTLPAIAAARKTEPAQLTRLLRGELDWIVMKCLEKDRARRYETANGLARDILHYLADEPVEACPPSTGYRLRKLARKHRKVLTAAAAFAFLLVAGAIASTLLAIRATRAEQLAGERLIETEEAHASAVQALDETRQAKAAADAALKRSEEDRRQAEAVSKYLVDVFRSPDPSKDGREIKVADLLERAEPRLTSEFAGDAVTRGRLLNALGRTYIGLALYPKAVAVLEKARSALQSVRGVDDPDTLMAMANLAEALDEVGRRRDAEALYKEVIERRERVLGPDHPDTLAAINDLGVVYFDEGRYAEDLPLIEQAFNKRQAVLGPDHPDTLESLNNLATTYRLMGRVHQALPLYEDVVKRAQVRLGPDHRLTLITRQGLGDMYKSLGRAKEALPILKDVVERMQAKLGPDHPDTLIAMSSLAATYTAAGRVGEGVPLAEEAFHRVRAKFGPDDLRTLKRLKNLIDIYRAAGKPAAELMPLREELVKQFKAKFGVGHVDTLVSMNDLAVAYHESGRLPEAVPLFEETLKRRRAVQGVDHPGTLLTAANLANAYQEAGRPELALPLLEQTFATCKAKVEHRDVLEVLNSLGLTYQEAGKPEQALSVYNVALPSAKKVGLANAITQEIIRNLGNVHGTLGTPAAAEPLLRELAEFQKQKAGADSAPYAIELMFLGKNLSQQQKWSEAESLVRTALAIREKGQPDAWATFNTRSMLGGVVLGQKKYAEAEPLLLKGYEGMKQREKTIPSAGAARIPEALDRLIELYTATNKPQEAKKWRAERAKYPASKPKR